MADPREQSADTRSEQLNGADARHSGVHHDETVGPYGSNPWSSSSGDGKIDLSSTAGGPTGRFERSDSNLSNSSRTDSDITYVGGYGSDHLTSDFPLNPWQTDRRGGGRSPYASSDVDPDEDGKIQLKDNDPEPETSKKRGFGTRSNSFRSSVSDEKGHEEDDGLTRVDPRPMDSEEVFNGFRMPTSSSYVTEDLFDQIHNTIKAEVKVATARKEGQGLSGYLGSAMEWLQDNPKLVGALTTMVGAGGLAYQQWGKGGVADIEPWVPASIKNTVGAVTTPVASLASDGVQAVKNEVRFRGTEEITHYENADLRGGEIRRSHWRMPVKFKIGRPRQDRVGSWHRAYKSTINVVARYQDKIRLGNELGTARVHSTERLDDQMIKRVGEALVGTFNTIEKLKKEVEAHQKAALHSGRARYVEPLSNDSKKALQQLGIHESEMGHLDSGKLQKLLDFAHPSGRIVSLTDQLPGRDHTGIPSALRSTSGKAGKSFGATGGSDFNRAPVADVKLHRPLVADGGSRDEAAGELMKAYMQRTGFRSLFTNGYEHTTDYKVGRATPTIADPQRDGLTHEIVNTVRDLADKAFDAGHGAWSGKNWREDAPTALDAAADKIVSGARDRIKQSFTSAGADELKEVAKAAANRTFDTASRSRANERSRGIGG